MRSGTKPVAAATAWNTLIDSVSPMTTLPGSAPISRAMRLPTRPGMVIQSALFQARINCSPHSRVITPATRACAASGSGPSELPSR